MNSKLALESLSDVYCTGCNERFQRVAISGICPRCGAKVGTEANALLSETLLYKDYLEQRADQSTPPTDASRELDQLSGTTLDIYQIESLLGRGGMGRVYLARHADLHRYCAVKILSPHLTGNDSNYTERFLLEGRVAAELTHPNIVTVHAIGQARDFHFLEMEFVAGRSLQRLVQDEGRLTAVRATALTLGISEGLSAAHRGDVIHRDLKPDNVLLSLKGIPKIADFGLAKRILPDNGKPRQQLVGTPNFMAPELFNGDAASPSSDVYALGVCYFLMLTGRLPFVGGSLTELRNTVTHDPFPNVRDFCSNITLEMAECLSLLLAKSPKNRPRDGIEACQLLHAVSGQIRDVESLLADAFRNYEDVTWSRTNDRYEVKLQLPEGRKQTVIVEPSDHETSERLLLIYSICCPAKAEFYEEALRLNSEVAHGGLAIRKIDGKKMFIMVDTYPRATVDPEEIRRSVLEAAYRADGVEKLLTGLDRH